MMHSQRNIKLYTGVIISIISNLGCLKSTLLLSVHHSFFCETFWTNAVRRDNLLYISSMIQCEVKRAAMNNLRKYHSNTRALLSKINLSGIEVLLCGVG
jgi:hypothetical protein